MSNKITFFLILAGSLGYFVDIYDILLFSIVRQESLRDIGVSAENLKDVGLKLMNFQLLGLAIGGVIWGIIGDKRGRIQILYGSIIIYSVANILNAYVATVEHYKILRFIAGIGLAGELGAGITLVSEAMKPKYRGYGAMVVASVGCLGVVTAIFVNQNFGWRTAYLIGGILGLLILLFRFNTSESEIYKKIQNEKHLVKGSLYTLVFKRKVLNKYIRSILIGAPTYFVISLLITLAPEFGQTFNLHNIEAGTAILIFYLANTVSDIICPLVSQGLKSRKKAILIFLTIELIGVLMFLYQNVDSKEGFYIKYIILGIGMGYWSTLLIYISEQFGTNLRATATTSIPNFIRAFAIPVIWLMSSLNQFFNLRVSTLLVAFVVFSVSFISLAYNSETFSKDLDFLE